MTRIGIRVNGEPDIGLGHIQRCLSLGAKLGKERTEVIFVCRKNAVARERIRREGFRIIELESSLSLNDDLQGTLKAVEIDGLDILITDSYEFDERYLTEIKKHVEILASVDDLAGISFPSDIVINQSVYAKDLSYHSLTGKTRFLLGPKYVLLREEFAGQGERKINEKVQNVLVTLGGNDPFNLTPRILSALNKISEDFTVTVAIGHFYDNVPEIENAAKKATKKVELIHEPSRMADLMLGSDLAIAGGGVTLYELAATGTPALAFCLADNQRRNVRGMEELGTLIDVGSGSEWQGEKFHSTVANLLDGYASRRRMTEVGQNLVDGKGAERVAKTIVRAYRFLEP